MSAPSRKYAGFIQIPASLTIAEVRRLYGTKLGSRHDLHMFLNMHSTTEVVGDLLKKNPCVALGLSSLSEKKEITRTVVNVPSSKMTMFDDGITTTYRVPYDGEKRYSECASCSQTYVFQRKTIGTQLYQEVFYLTPGGAEFRGWNPDYVILPKGAWIFVTSDEDPLKW
ncbi:MAG: hypothetical protein LRY46_03425 [Candidatus Pacebacteria bacterium]|nr:hypothetical protein [Candidatus Paceibacterota bacterium]